MRVTEKPDKAVALVLAAEKRLHRERAPGWHVSDLVRCLRATWYEKQAPTLREPSTQEEGLIFLLGNSHHALLQPEMGGECSVGLLLDGHEETVHGTIDIWLPAVWTEMFTNPWEIKTTRSDDTREPVYSMPHYIEQLASYCLAAGQLRGTLAVWYIFAVPPVIRVWDFDFTEAELEQFRGELSRRLTILKDSSTIPSEDEHRRGECRFCPWHKKNLGPCKGGDGRIADFFWPANYV